MSAYRNERAAAAYVSKLLVEGLAVSIEPNSNGTSMLVWGIDRSMPIELLENHYYDEDERCVCGGLVVYFEDNFPPGHGCEVQGQPWNEKFRLLDPQERRWEREIARRGGL